MAPKTPDVFEPARQTAERMTEHAQEAITNYFGWLQSAMQTTPWGNTDLNKKLMSYAVETVTAPLSLRNWAKPEIWKMSSKPKRSLLERKRIHLTNTPKKSARYSAKLQALRRRRQSVCPHNSHDFGEIAKRAASDW